MIQFSVAMAPASSWWWWSLETRGFFFIALHRAMLLEREREGGERGRERRGKREREREEVMEKETLLN